MIVKIVFLLTLGKRVVLWTFTLQSLQVSYYSHAISNGVFHADTFTSEWRGSFFFKIIMLKQLINKIKTKQNKLPTPIAS